MTNVVFIKINPLGLVLVLVLCRPAPKLSKPNALSVYGRLQGRGRKRGSFTESRGPAVPRMELH